MSSSSGSEAFGRPRLATVAEVALLFPRVTAGLVATLPLFPVALAATFGAVTFAATSAFAVLVLGVAFAFGAAFAFAVGLLPFETKSRVANGRELPFSKKTM